MQENKMAEITFSTYIRVWDEQYCLFMRSRMHSTSQSDFCDKLNLTQETLTLFYYIRVRRNFHFQQVNLAESRLLTITQSEAIMKFLMLILKSLGTG